LYSLILGFLVSVVILSGKYKSATGTTFIVASIYVYFGVLQLGDSDLDWRFNFLILAHFFLSFIAPTVKISPVSKGNKSNVVKSISHLMLWIYLLILILNFDPTNLELSRMKTFGSYKPLYYNVLVIWPVLFLLRDKVRKYEIALYIIVCFLTGFRSLLVNFMYLIIIKSVLTNKSFSFLNLLFLGGLIVIGATVLSSFRDGSDGSVLFEALVHRLFLVNAENIESIVALQPQLGFEMILRDFVPLRYLTMFFHDYHLTSAEYITRDLNLFFFNTGRIMTPTMFGLGIAAWGLNGLFLPVGFVFFLDYLVSVLAYAWVRRVWLVWVFLSISFVTRGVFSVLGLYGTLACVVLILSSTSFRYVKRSYN
jgi:hypothetical protein